MLTWVNNFWSRSFYNPKWLTYSASSISYEILIQKQLKINLIVCDFWIIQNDLIPEIIREKKWLMEIKNKFGDISKIENSQLKFEYELCLNSLKLMEKDKENAYRALINWTRFEVKPYFNKDFYTIFKSDDGKFFLKISWSN